jgi:hypothetical protein
MNATAEPMMPFRIMGFHTDTSTKVTAAVVAPGGGVLSGERAAFVPCPRHIVRATEAAQNAWLRTQLPRLSIKNGYAHYA